jgi:hypothetical protein
MALSNSFDYTVTAADIILGALEKLGVVEAGETPDTDDKALMLRELNKLVKQWSHPADGSPGLQVGLRQVVYLFLAEGTREYLLGPSGVRAAESYNTTTVDVAEASGQTTLSIAATTNMANSDIIGVELDDGSLHWSTVSSFSAGDTVTIAAATTAAASVGNRVFYYTPVSSQNYLPFRPLEVITAMLRYYDGDGNAIDGTRLDVYSREELPAFEETADKSDMADPTAMFVEPLRTQTRITLDAAAEDVAKLIRMVVLSPADDLDADTDSVAFPPEWFAALEWELAKRSAPSFRAPWGQTHEANWAQATGIARQANPRGYQGGFRAVDGDEDEMSL